MGCLFLFQGIFPTQGLNPGLLCCRQILYRLSHQRKWSQKGSTWNLEQWQWEYRVVGGQQTWEGRCQHVEPEGDGSVSPSSDLGHFPQRSDAGGGRGWWQKLTGSQASAEMVLLGTRHSLAQATDSQTGGSSCTHFCPRGARPPGDSAVPSSLCLTRLSHPACTHPLITVIHTISSHCTEV